jgi:DNA repair exonuclease SbcCD ATPase subunit
MSNKITIIESLKGRKFVHVWHCADIHIRLQSRHDEYRSCFRRLFKILKDFHDRKHKGQDGIVVVCGDILHSKCELTPEALTLVQLFFSGFPYPVICIAGNHDANLSNSDRMDSLSPILSNIPNVYYLRDSGLYRAGNIIFGVSSILDGKLTKPPSVEKGVHRIALFHGPVNGCITDVGVRLASERTVDDFEGWDYGMFGDIHKCQSMKIRMAYPGSLIQQNFGETGFHGILFWTLGEDRATRVPISNDWGFHRLRVINGKIQNEDTVSKHPRIELHIESGTVDDISRLERHLRKTYQVESFEPIRVEKDPENEMHVLKTLTMGSFLPLKMLVAYLEHLKVPKDQIDRIGKMHHTWRRELTDKDTGASSAIGRWIPTRMLFHNMFSYKGSWHLEFGTGMLGRFGMNGTGKSSTIDILILLLFDKPVRSDKRAINEKIITKGEVEFKGMVEFTHAGSTYCVYREGKKSSRGLHVKTRFWQIGRKGQITDLTGKDRLETNRTIESVIGSYEEAMNIGVMLQKSGSGFVDETPMRRKERINRILNLDKFDRISERISEAKRTANAELKILGNVDSKEQFDIEEQHDIVKDRITHTKERIEKCNKVLEKFGNYESYDDPEAELEELENKIKEGTKKLKELPLGSSNCDKLKKLQSEIIVSQELESCLDVISMPICPIENILREMKQILQRNDTYSGGTHILKGLAQLFATKKEIHELEVKISKSKEQVKKLASHKYNKDCTYCCDNPFVKEAQSDKEELPKLIQYLEKLSGLMSVASGDNDEFIKDAERYKTLFGQLNNTLIIEERDLQIEKIKQLVERGVNMRPQVLQVKIDKEQKLFETQLERHKLEEKLKNYNSKYNKLKEYIKSGISDTILEHKRLSERLLQDTERYGMLKEKLSELKVTAKRFKNVQMQLEDLTIYSDTMSRDGIPKQLAARLIPRLETEINTVIAQISDFRISIDPLTASMTINNTKNNTGKDSGLDAQMCCGSEKLIIELSLRAVIATMSCASSPGILLLDESLNDFDVDKRSSLENLFHTLVHHFDTVLLITHQDYVKGLVDKQIVPCKDVNWKHELVKMPTGTA